ncbi:photosystem reaction center subunit H [Pseudomonas syringae CC1557]|uniref:Photosystem reaction center subunit H n=1 Tax=Pseudomonas syringae CC1557 TaxID=1357279 RepID=W0MRU7_PSESX|nr:PRC-barrel domain-containing protein [Pseudomonas syringae]AHG41299.1 photosystem reaction center subunit H [Pseudomonas syringae CC1557]
MLRSMQDLEDYMLIATDGDIGKVKDFYFDDEAWVIRYLIVDTGSRLSSRSVLISPLSIRRHDWASRQLLVMADRDRIKNSPSVGTDEPVSRQHEIQYLDYYGHPYYWNVSEVRSSAFHPADNPAQEGSPDHTNAEWSDHQDNDPHLRSCKALIGYHIKATDGEVGHVESLLINEDTWAVQYLVVNTRNWWVGQHVLIAPEWIDRVSWQDKWVSLDLDCAAVRSSPYYESSEQLNREREAALHAHYGRVGYWHV